MSHLSSDPLEQAAVLYASYVEISEISTLAELAQEVGALDSESQWCGVPPAGLVVTG